MALIGNLDFSELVIILVAAILIFGSRLPRVAGQAGFYLARLRRSLEALWQDTGVVREIRSVQRELQSNMPHNMSLGEMARQASADIQRQLDEADRVVRTAGSDAAPEEVPEDPFAPPKPGAEESKV